MSSRSRSRSWSACSPSSRTARPQVGLLFGPIMLIYFVTIAVLGVIHIVDHPAVLYEMLNPLNAVAILSRTTGAGVHRHGLGRARGDRRRSALCRHGAFRAQPDPGVVALFRHARAAAQLHGAGRDAAVAGPRRRRSRRSRIRSSSSLPKRFACRSSCSPPLATIIASQAVISGAFSVTQQAIQLGFIPRLRITHTSETRAPARSTSR